MQTAANALRSSCNATRKVAAHEVVTEKGITEMAVVEIEGDRVVAVYPLTGEEPHTEWLGGTICIKGDKAYWKEKEILNL